MTEETQLVIMLRDKASGFLEKEYAAISLAELGEFEALLVNVYAEREGGETLIHVKLSTARDVEDWQFSAVFDYYDEDVFAGLAEVREVEDVFNPTWELVFAAPAGTSAELAAKVKGLLEIHSRELADVFEAIAGKESEYTDE